MISKTNAQKKRDEYPNFLNTSQILSDILGHDEKKKDL